MMMHSSPWPWPATTTPGRHSARSMLDLLSGLPVLGWELSCRLSAHGTQTGRLLAGINRDTLSASRWGKLFDEIGLPVACRQAIEQDLGSADRIYIACEQGSRSVTRKLYLEFTHAARHRPGERLGILGYKWVEPDTPSKGLRITEYWTQEQLDAHTAMAALQNGRASGSVDPGPGASVVNLLIQALAHALLLAGPDRTWQHEHIRVCEADTPRASLAFNFYGSGLRAGDLTDAVTALADEWRLNATDIRQLLEAMAQRELAWLAGGLDTHGEPFLTIYCAASREDVIQACFAADPTLGESVPPTVGRAA
jgi:hypothetical protein